MIRIKDIARRAGVSATTVSNVIHGNTKKVSQSTIDLIKQIMEETNYVPSMSARLLAGSRSRIIGVILAAAGQDSASRLQDAFAGTILGAIETEIFRNGYYMMFHISSGDTENSQLASAWQIDGLITVSVPEEDNLHLSKMLKVPIVSVDNYYTEPALPNVGLDDFDGGYRMARCLLEKGHRNILFLSAYDKGGDLQRWLGVAKALDEAKVTDVNARRIIMPGDVKERMEMHRKNLKLYRENTALFFASDYYAAEGMQFLQEQGFRVPEDISIAGFDDSLYATILRPKLTTVGQDMQEKGRLAVRMLINLIETGEKKTDGLQKKLPVQLIERDSVRNLK